MTRDEPLYRTLIVGTLVQETGLSVGGAANADGTDTCHRDGRGRLTIPGTGLAGQLIETAARVLPNLINEQDGQRTLGYQITAKEPKVPQRQRDEEDRRFRQSVWRFEHAHPETHDDKKPPTEWRQGVGIRQATGASAGEKRALYDFEFVPAGTRWSFFLEIDTHRGGKEAEAIAVMALAEWVRGYGWLGRSAARGTGWFILDRSTLQVVRLPKTPEVIQRWPDNTRRWQDALAEVTSQARADSLKWEDVFEEASQLAAQRAIEDGQRWRRSDWHYLSFRVRLSPGLAEGGYGWNVLQVGSHPSVALTSHQSDPLPPLSVADKYGGEQEPSETTDPLEHWRLVNGEFKLPDAPFVTTQPATAKGERPYLPGGGLRGPLRHTASRVQRSPQQPDGRAMTVRDPNWKQDPSAKELQKALKAKRQHAAAPAYDADVRPLCDSVAQLFGVEELGGRLLVSDARLTKDEFQLARVDHHAEDEFTAGVYGSGKFDRNVLLSGQFEFRVVVEGPTREELRQSLQPLLPALDLAALGHVPIGGGKWRGAGWLKWEVSDLELRRAGDEASSTPQPAEPAATPSQRVVRLWNDPSAAT